MMRLRLFRLTDRVGGQPGNLGLLLLPPQTPRSNIAFADNQVMVYVSITGTTALSRKVKRYTVTETDGTTNVPTLGFELMRIEPETGLPNGYNPR